MTRPTLQFARFLVGLTFAFSAAARPSSAATFSELAKLVPEDANAVIVVNAAALYASPLGQREGWKEKYADRFEAAPLVLPPSAARGVLAAEVELHSLRPQWQAAAMELSIDPSPADIARRRGGRTDYVNGVQAAWLGDRLFIAKLAPQTFGVLLPATRQQAAQRWIADVKDGSAGNLSPYLQQAISFADGAGTDVVLAVDLANTFTEENLRASAEGSAPLQGISSAAAAEVLASIQGVKFGVKVGDRLVGRLQFDFAKDATILGAVAKPLILKILARSGAMLPEFANWTAEPGPTSIALQGELTPDGMRRVFSLLALDAGTLESAEPETAPQEGDPIEAAKKAMGIASQRYFRGISKYVEDVQRLDRAASLDQAIMWIENYARKIDALPATNVDPELRQYGTYVAQTFRSIVDQASGALDQADAASQPVVTNYNIGFLPTARTVNYGGNFQRMYAPYGHANVDVKATEEQIQKSDEQVNKAVQQAKTTLGQLISDHETVRQKMSEKYGLKF